jgi:heat shock protein HslJ
MKKIFIGTCILVALITAAAIFVALKEPTTNTNSNTAVPNDYKNAGYFVEGKSVQLVNGVSETETAPGSASKTITRHFGNEVQKDLNGDGVDDVVFLLTQETGGSGTFFYVVAALKTPEGYTGSHAILLGDRIAPQTTESGPGNSVIVNYADRAPGDNFSAQPSIGKSLRLILDPTTMQFGEVVPDFEGEADPARMSLTMKTWEWIRTDYTNGKTTTPKIPKKFTLTFTNTDTFSVTTDCNGAGGTYAVSGDGIKFGNIASTLMYCEGSQESEFTTLLTEAEKFELTSKGELLLKLIDGRGTVIFR